MKSEETLMQMGTSNIIFQN